MENVTQSSIHYCTLAVLKRELMILKNNSTNARSNLHETAMSMDWALECLKSIRQHHPHLQDTLGNEFQIIYSKLKDDYDALSVHSDNELLGK